jgi:pimeloyl-[acyl-carrier protein] methyl ester esterase
MKSCWLHGWATDKIIFKDIIDCLGSPCKAGACALDLPGFGASAPLEDGESYSGRIFGEIDTHHRASRSVALVGWSLGALVALEVAGRLGGKLSALVLISACERFSLAGDNPHGMDRRRLDIMRRHLEKGLVEKVLDEFYHGMFENCDNALEIKFRQEFRAGYLKQAPEPLIAGLRYLAEVNLSGCNSMISAPVLILHGGQDTVIDPRLAESLEQALPKARLVIFEDTGHMPFLGREKEFAGLIEDFFEANKPDDVVKSPAIDC